MRRGREVKGEEIIRWINSISGMISVLVVLIIGIAVVMPVMTDINKNINLSDFFKSSSTDTLVTTLIQILPLFIAIALILVVVGMFPFGGRSYGSSDDEVEESESEKEEEEEEKEEEPEEASPESDRTKQQLLAEKILKRRYARGELTDEEYTEKMARL
jgi:uncharacterized membrane protein